MHAHMHAQFAALMTLPTTEPRRMPIVSCALIYDTAIRVSAVTADRTGKFALLTVTSSDVYNVALRYVTIISVSVGVFPSLSSLLQVAAANYLGRRIGSSLDVAPFKRHASAQDQEERKDAA